MKRADTDILPKLWSPSLEALALLAVTLPLALYAREPALWFLVPFAVITMQRRTYADYGLDFSARTMWGTPRFHLLTCAIIFVPYAMGHILLARVWFGQHFTFALPERLPMLLWDQLLGVALPEEFFFRGYLQSQLNASFGRPYRTFGAAWGLGLVFGAALFALCHVPLGGPGQLIVFFPGLLYGWLRERTDNVLVPTVYHAVSNVLLKTMLLSLH
ncbi:MAG: CPBP family intramembrane metalloprotease [Deltaproteobacteria bacterium]|nr:CPBP family intramembrane metalloprotease [Deltaproteobacteria bacterium]MBI3388665.1 CPBP family intramembrane metalloprotease [Deltaproteobacteria bacterium]